MRVSHSLFRPERRVRRIGVKGDIDRSRRFKLRKTAEAYRYHSYGAFDEACDLYMVAASRGYPEAQLNIGNYYATGVAPKAPTDNVEAVKWYLLSGIGVGEHYAGLLREEMTDTEWAEAERRVAAWQPARAGPARSRVTDPPSRARAQHNGRGRRSWRSLRL